MELHNFINMSEKLHLYVSLIVELFLRQINLTRSVIPGLRWFTSKQLTQEFSFSLELMSPLQVTHLPPLLLPLTPDSF